MEDPAVLANRPTEKQEEKIERDSRALVKRLLTFGLTEQVPVLVSSSLSVQQKNFVYAMKQSFLNDPFFKNQFPARRVVYVFPEISGTSNVSNIALF